MRSLDLNQFVHCLLYQHQPGLVLVAAVVCTLTAFSVFLILEHARLSRTRVFAWASLTGLVSGVGIWATHFVAMLSYDPGVPAAYGLWGTLLSLAVAVVVTGFGWWLLLTRRRASPYYCAITVTAGIAMMHYLGMAALDMPAQVSWDPWLIGASLLISTILTCWAVREHQRRPMAVPWRAASAFVLAICALHFLGMGAVIISPDPAKYVAEATIGRSELIAMVVAGSVLVVALGFFVMMFDRVTGREKAAAKIAHLAYRDVLTGLANRSVLQQHMSAAMSAVTAVNETLAVVCVDLDGFKAVNDTHGHAAGDELLIEVAERLRSVVRGSEMIARTGGDEFIVVQTGDHQPEAAGMLGERLIGALSQPFLITGKRVQIGASVGVALFPRDASDQDELVRKADAALYRAKSDGRGVTRFYDASIAEGEQTRERLEADLPAAIRNGHLHLVYQPVQDLASRTVTGFEALVRWSHPELGVIEPKCFLRIAEERGLAQELDRWVLQTATHAAASWPSSVDVSVNISPDHLVAGDLAKLIAQVLENSGLAAGRLAIEVSEVVLSKSPVQVLRCFTRLNSLGVRICIDDFGGSHSSIGAFRAFPFDKIKIDRSFVADLAEHASAREIVRSIVSLGRNLDVIVVAAGVETSEQMTLLSQLGCTQVQGFLIGRPRAEPMTGSVPQDECAVEQVA